MTWTRAILLGALIWGFVILALGQLPSYIIYWVDGNIDSVIEWTKAVPGVNQEGLNTIQIQMIRDVIANTVQMGILTVMLIGAYVWQQRKRRRIGGKGPQDTVKGYMPGK
jgi:hypothetical protein